MDKASADLKTSFKPISNSETELLILGSLPGDTSILLKEYYAHPRNRFWKIIASITNNELPTTYEDKKALLIKSKIGVWDIAHQANRKGSLDSAILDVKPNDITSFINLHKKLKTIGFNGAKAEALFNKHFKREPQIQYISLPSTSPANAGITLEKLSQAWKQKLFL